MNHSPRSSSALPPIAVHHILLKSELLAQDVLHELSLGADFADLAAEYSSCPSAQQHGFAGYHSLDDLPASLASAFGQYQGESPYVGPVQSSYGFHILKPTAVLERTLLVDDAPLDEAEDSTLSNDQPG